MNKPKKSNQSKIENEVMAKINSGQIKMHSRLYYVSIGALSIVIIGIMSVILSYLFSLLLLWSRIQSTSGRAWGAQRNITTLIDNFPWWAVVLGAILTVGLVLIVKKLGKVYKVRLAYLVTAIIATALFVGYGLSFTKFPNTFKGRHHQTICNSTSDNCVTKVQGRQFGR